MRTTRAPDTPDRITNTAAKVLFIPNMNTTRDARNAKLTPASGLHTIERSMENMADGMISAAIRLSKSGGVFTRIRNRKKKISIRIMKKSI